MPKKLSAKEALFCEYYKILNSPREAAARAGYAFPEKSGLRLLKRAAIKTEISARLPTPDALDGLRRIAFGSNCDAVYLCLRGAEIEKEELEKLDLFSVSELKIQKNGAVEVKFFDRIKALDMLSGERKSASSSAEPFYRALSEGAKNLKGEGLSDGI